MNDEITILGPDALPDEWLARIKPELAPGERLIWAGQSNPKFEMSGRWFATIYAVGFAVLSLVGFAGLFGHLGERIHNFESGLSLMGIGCGAVAFLISLGVIANVIDKGSERRLLRNNLYALTDSRAIIWSPEGRGVNVQSTLRGSVKGVHRTEYADGSGTVLFNLGSPSFSATETGFHNVPDARRVEALVRLHLIGDDGTTTI